MLEMIKNINEHKYNNNIDICYKLCTYINNNKIKDESTLKNIEDGYFNSDDIKDRNNIKYTAYISDYTHLEKFDQNIIAKLIQYENEYEVANNEEEKTKLLILIYNLINWELVFPYTAYKLILSDRMN